MLCKTGRILFLLLMFSIPIAHAECMEVRLPDQYAKAAVVARGKVIASSEVNALLTCANGKDEPCNYKFTVQIDEVYKGSVPTPKLNFEYKFWIGCPGVDTFPVGTERIWFISEAVSEGNSTLLGNSCRAGWSMLEKFPEIKALADPQSAIPH